jgi:hypothetical protein
MPPWLAAYAEMPASAICGHELFIKNPFRLLDYTQTRIYSNGYLHWLPVHGQPELDLLVVAGQALQVQACAAAEPAEPLTRRTIARYALSLRCFPG